VYYEAVGELYASVKKTLRDSCFDCPAIIQLGFWPGGDRDGNPFVTAAITADVADELRMTLMKCYYRDVKRLARKLTFRGVEDRPREVEGQALRDHVRPGPNDPI
jgi:phosphoenolpyruvate carboxylase